MGGTCCSCEPPVSLTARPGCAPAKARITSCSVLGPTLVSLLLVPFVLLRGYNFTARLLKSHVLPTPVISYSPQESPAPLQATHIFDGLESWPTHLVYAEGGKMIRGGPVESIPEMQAAAAGKKLLHIVEGWLREEKRKRREAAAAAGPQQAQQQRRSPLMPSKHMAFFR